MVREVLQNKLAVMGDSIVVLRNEYILRQSVEICDTLFFINLVCHNQLVWSAYLAYHAPNW